MAFYRGEQGNVLFKHDSGDTLTVVAAVRTWSLTIDKESLEVTKMGDSFRDRVGGLIAGSGTIEVFYEKTAAGDGKGDLIREILTTPATESTVAGAELYTFDAGSQGSGSEKISFNILITSAEFSATVGELQVVTLSFDTKGAVAIASV
jgi:predicted secreted protein|nr:phage major tail protein 2 [uncultured Mediterranean phage uvMED]BAR24946.1 phage major tail protein 2 [uncultured Mediterranean phage uvMED]BAR39249.1 phage major tail protein 2 [uncultured Mediterranean phage uvMED]